MATHEEQTRAALLAWDKIVATGDIDIEPDSAHVPLSMLKGLLLACDPEEFEAGLSPYPTEDEAEDWLNAVYAVLGHHESVRLARGLNDD